MGCFETDASIRFHTADDGDDLGELDILVQAPAPDESVWLHLCLEQPAPSDSVMYTEWVAGVADLVDTSFLVTEFHALSAAELVVAGIGTVPHYAAAWHDFWPGDAAHWAPNLLNPELDLEKLDPENEDHWVLSVPRLFFRLTDPLR